MATIRNLAELKARGVLEDRDRVVFTHGGKELIYIVMSDALISDNCYLDHVFTVLSLKPREFASQAFGYRAGNCISPCYKQRDYAAATRLVEALYREIARQAGTDSEASYPIPPKKRTPGQQALISSAADVDAYMPLESGDRVFFQTPQGEFSVKVAHDHDGFYCKRGCSEPGSSNEVFTRLGEHNNRRYAETVVGERPTPGSYDFWPQYRDVNDFAKLLKGLLTAYGQTGEMQQPAAGPRTFTSAEELRGVELKQDDQIKFVYRDRSLTLSVTTNDRGSGAYASKQHESRRLIDAFFSGSDIQVYEIADRVLGMGQGCWHPFFSAANDASPEVRRQRLKDLLLALYEALEQASTPAEEVPTGPRTITNVAELRAAMPLSSKWETPHKVIIMLHGKKHAVATGDRGGVYLSGVGSHLGLDTMAEILGPAVDIPKYIASIVGYELKGFEGVEVKNVEDLAKVIEDLMIRAGQGERPFAEGDIVKNTGGPIRRGWLRRILRVIDGGKRFRLSDDWRTVEDLYGNSAPNLGGETLSLEDLKEQYVLFQPADEPEDEPSSPEEERPFVEGDIVKDSDGDFRRILAVSTDGQSFLLSNWFSTLEELNTADDLIDGSEGISLEDLEEEYTRVDPTPAPAKKVITLTRQQIAEKFGIEPDQLKIEEAA